MYVVYAERHNLIGKRHANFKGNADGRMMRIFEVLETFLTSSVARRLCLDPSLILATRN